MRRNPESSRRPPFDDAAVRRHFDRAGVAAAYLFGSVAAGEANTMSDIDLAYLGTDAEVEDRLFDELYEALQGELGEGAFDLVPLRRAPMHLRFAVLLEGRPLLIRDPALAESFTAGAIIRYLDFKPYRDQYFSAGR